MRGAEEKQLQLQKADAKKLREQNKLLNMKLKEEKRVAAEQHKVKRKEKKTEVAAERARKLEERNTRAAKKNSPNRQAQSLTKLLSKGQTRTTFWQ
jgi:hypothetical protein